ncbi:molybdopterin-dependent oxidoreductase [Archangium gephyra]|uniref:molybdopterin-dependent oxidoreductase n=1 Tax=Archangium gephyra TaxID=48 RepID=UPI003B791008
MRPSPSSPGKLNALGSPDEACFYTSGRTSNEAAFLYQLLVRQFGTNNLPDCSNMCHESSGTALLETIGIGKGTVTLEDFEKAQVIVVIGQNPGTNHPRMLTALEAARRQGCRIMSINPLPEPGLQRFKHPQAVRGILGSGTPLAELFLQVRINGDVALLQGLGKALLEREAKQPGTVVARDFVEGRTLGYEAYAAHLGTVSWEDVVEQSGVSREQLETAAEWLAGTDRIIWCWAMGLTQHRNAVGNIQEIVNLTLLRGSIGKPGAGVCPVRGHSNVQGDRTMGIWERPRPAFLDALSREPRLRTAAPPRARHGGHHPGDARGPGEGLLRPGRQFPVGHARHRAHRRGPAPHAADGARVHQAEPGAPRHRQARAHPAVPGPHRERRAGGRAAVRHGGELDGRGARLARDADTGLGAPAQRARARGEAGARGARVARHGAVGVAGGGLRPCPRPHLAGDSGVRGLQPAGA